MKIRLRTLKRILREAIKPEDKAQQVLQHALQAAQDYVDSVVADHRDAHKAETLRAAAENVTSLAKFLLGKRDPRAESIAQAAMYVKQVADESGFWQTPMFLNKGDHAEKLQQAMRKAERAAMGALKPS